MQYLKYIFENEDVRALTESNEEVITNLVNENIGQFVLTNFTYVVENLEKFMTDDLTVAHENIKRFITNDMVNMISAISEVASLDNNFDHVASIMDENVSSVFTGFGFGNQKAQRLIASSYTA